MSHQQKVLNWTAIHPYVSITILRCTGDDFATAFAKVRDFLLQPGKSRVGRETEIVAADLEARFADEGIDQLAGFVRQQRDRPAWAAEDAGIQDVVHKLTVALRRQRLIAIHCDSTTHDRLQRWLDKSPRPPLARIPPQILEAALHCGDTRSLWLRGVHRPRTTKPDIKSIGGLRLQDTVNPFEDASYTVGAARSELPESPDRLVLNGVIGSTPSESSTWFKAAPDFSSFVTAVVELLILIEKELVSGPVVDAFPHFARAVSDLREVSGAYEIRVTPPEHLPPSASEDMRDAAALLLGAELDVSGQPSSARFFIDVGLNGVISGQLAAKPVLDDPLFRLDIGFHGTPSNLAPVRQVLDSLAYNKDLISVYYASGHTLIDGRIWQERPRDFAFPNWSFQDYAGFEIEHEKPAGGDPQSIHDSIAEPGDRSLFGWVVSKFNDGWLICDDGPGETADFLHVSPQGHLSIIHVKGAKNAAPGRRVALGAFEIVVSQAIKNLVFTDRDLLRHRLASPRLTRPACWNLGVRSPSREEFLEALELRDATNTTEVVIVQPHVSKATHTSLQAKSVGATVTENLLRLRLLEELLNSARSTITEVGADLTVMGSLV
ncbi:hypothetical protein ABT256_22875 [Amycolatopsis japonica]|uniref:hypothetical protein n=1 Tax=Amycolatopsis japonica TaxID=208439 RepID=UPI0033305935